MIVHALHGEENDPFGTPANTGFTSSLPQLAVVSCMFWVSADMAERSPV